MWWCVQYLSIALICSLAALAAGLADEFEAVPRPGRHKELMTTFDQLVIQQKKDRAEFLYRQQHWFDLDPDTRSGNKVEILLDGPALKKARLDMIHSARKSIYVSTYSFNEDPFGKEMAELLCAKKKENEKLDIRVLHDFIHARKMHFPNEKRFKDCKIPLMYYNWTRYTGLLNVLYGMHEKMLIVDGEKLVVGGSNFGKAYEAHSVTRQSWQDLDARVDGPAACQMHREFVKTWKDTVKWTEPLRFKKQWRKKHFDRVGDGNFVGCEEKSLGNSRVLPIYSGPRLRKWKTPLLDHYLKAFAAARSEILLYMPYFMPKKVFREALLAAHTINHVKVKIIVNSASSTDEKGSEVPLYALAGPLVKAGIEIYSWPEKSTLHRKGGVIDGKWAFVGSDNLTGRAQRWNTENIIITDDPQAVALVAGRMKSDFEGAIPVTEEMLKKGWSALKWKIREAFHLFSGYMTGD